MSKTSQLASAESGLIAPWGKSNASVTTTKSLTRDELGLVLIDATAAAVTVTLPAANAPLEVMVRRVDASANVLTIQAAGTDKLLIDTTTGASGQASTELIFAGDFLYFRSDAAGKWWCLSQAELPGSVASGRVSIPTVGVSTFIVPGVLRSGRRRARVTVVGGGGGGGSAVSTASFNAGGGGGGGGGHSLKLVDLTGTASVSVTVGVGGAAAIAGGAFAVQGGTSGFGGFFTASGGYPGASATASATSTEAAGGGPGGTGASGDFNGTGHAGLSGIAAKPTTAGSSVGPGFGGGSAISGHGGPGSGGAGAATTGGSQSVNGSIGYSGHIIVEW